MTRLIAGVWLLLMCSLLALAPTIAQAAQSYDNCAGFITSLPATITTQGTWCMKQDLSTNITSGAAISVNTNNVVIDCNDYKLGGLAAGTGTATGGISAVNRSNITVRHCNIRGFYSGVNLDGGAGHVVEDNRFDGNTYFGLRIAGDASVARRNLVFDTGGSTIADGTAHGIRTYGGNVDVIDNTVNNVTASGNSNAYGIYDYDNTSGSINGNRISGVLKAGTGTSSGIYETSSVRSIITGNHMVGDGTAGSQGIGCDGSAVSASGNVVSGFAAAVLGCSDDGGNIFRP